MGYCSGAINGSIIICNSWYGSQDQVQADEKGINMRKLFHQRLEEITEDVIDMGKLAREA